MAGIDTSINLLAPPVAVFDAWMSESIMQKVTGVPARIHPQVGGTYSLWEGHVQGEFVFIQRPHRIACTWRTSDFGPTQPSSRLEISFEPTFKGTRVHVVHDAIPAPLKKQFVYAWTDVVFPGLLQFVPTVH